MLELPECEMSPSYVAFTVIDFEEDVDGVYNTVQALNERLHEAVLNVPPAFPSLHDTVPVGLGDLGVSRIESHQPLGLTQCRVVDVLDISTIFAVNVTCDP